MPPLRRYDDPPLSFKPRRMTNAPTPTPLAGCQGPGDLHQDPAPLLDARGRAAAPQRARAVARAHGGGTQERIFIELMTSDRKLKASREGTN